jgi:hypothetical protein
MGLSDKAFNADNSKELASIGINAKPFPYWPPQVSNEELMRMEVMMELNKWANNDPELAKRSATTLIVLLSKQFSIDLKEIK